MNTRKRQAIEDPVIDAVVTKKDKNNYSKIIDDLRLILLGPDITATCESGAAVSEQTLKNRLYKLKQTGCSIASTKQLAQLCEMTPTTLTYNDNEAIRSLAGSLKKECKTGTEDYKVLKCRDTNECLSFEPDQTPLNNFFKFGTFEYLEKSRTFESAAESVNGTISLLTYKRTDSYGDTYTSSAILKTSKKKEADNLFYEYLVGVMFINKQMTYFPCFVETYGIYMSSGALKNAKDLKNNLKPLELDLQGGNLSDLITTSCKFSDKLSLLIATIPRSKTIDDFLTLDSTTIYDISNVLFQVYAVLAVLAKEFTHYDLHTGNVLLYEVPNAGFITMNYKDVNGTITSFNTRFVAKLIDYGRSFYSGAEKLSTTLLNSTNLYDAVKMNNDCANKKRKTSPDNFGYSFFDQVGDSNNFYITAVHANKSHDLRLLSVVVESDLPALKTKAGRTWKNKFNTLFVGPYGTPIKEGTGLKQIYNVQGAYEKLRDYLRVDDKSSISVRNEYTYAGTLDVSLDHATPIKFMV